MPLPLQTFFPCIGLKRRIRLSQFSSDGGSDQANPGLAISWIDLHFYKNLEPVVYMLQALNQLRKDTDEIGAPFVSNCFDTTQNYWLHCNEGNI